MLKMTNPFDTNATYWYGRFPSFLDSSCCCIRLLFKDDLVSTMVMFTVGRLLQMRILLYQLLLVKR